MTTRGDARASAVEALRRVGDTTAALDADLLLAHVLGLPKESLYAHLDADLAPTEAAAYEAAVERRAAGEPIAYIRGYKEFFGLRFAVDPRVLIPRPETETLVEAALAFIRSERRFRVADVGTGSGAIAVALAVSEPRVRVVATDISSDALAVARANAVAHGVGDRVDLREGDLLSPVDVPADVVAANLPYLTDDPARWTGQRSSLSFEPRAAVVAGSDGLAVISRLVVQLPDKLAPGGAAFLECDPAQADAVAALLRSASLSGTRIIDDLSGAPRVVAGERR